MDYSFLQLCNDFKMVANASNDNEKKTDDNGSLSYRKILYGKALKIQRTI